MEKENWHRWRRKGLGASDSPAVMGVSPWTTRYQLWLEKTGKKVSDSSDNFATERGNILEPMARADYELRHGLEMPVVYAEHKGWPFIRASLDGYNAQHGIILEIKCPGEADHETAKSGHVPEKYWPQLQHQLLVTGAKELHYYSFDGKCGVLVKVQPDLEYIKKLTHELMMFWAMVMMGIPPAKVKEDFKLVRFKGAAQMVRDFRAGKLELLDLQERLPDREGCYRIDSLLFESGVLLN